MSVNTKRLIKNTSQFDKGLASEELRTGLFVERGGSEDFQTPSNEGQNGELLYALPVDPAIEIVDDWTDTDNTIASGEQMQVFKPYPGQKLYGWLKDGENVSEGDELTLTTDGSLVQHSPQTVDEGGTNTYTIYSDAIKVYAAEGIDNSGGSNPVRIDVRVA